MRAGEFGVVLTIETAFAELADVETCTLVIRPPGAGAAVVRRVIPVPASGTVYAYTTADGDFTAPGTYTLQTEVTLWGRARYLSNPVRVTVDRSI